MKILTNANIYTFDDNRPRAQAIAINENKIVAVGDESELTPVGRPYEKIDLDGAMVIPGLVDAHVHFRMFALTLARIDVYEVPTKEEALRRVAAKAAEAQRGRWLTGRGWKNELWADTAFPTAADLDRVAPDNPVVLNDKSGHAAWANSLALQMAGITDGTPHPEGGEIQRDGAGRATGILFETAIDLVRNHLPRPTEAETVAAMKLAQQKCWEVGLTGVHDFDGVASFKALQTLHKKKELGLRIVKNLPARYLDHAVAIGLRSGFGDDFLRIGGIKIFADGALGPQTALMIEPYENNSQNYGIAVTDKEEMHAIASKAAANGLSVTVHAIGDKAVHDILDVYEGLGDSGLLYRIEHVQVFHPSDRQRLAKLGVIASMQPIHATSDMEMADRYWGDRAVNSYALHDMLESGALLVLGSDCPVEPIDVLPNIYAAVTRKKPGSSYAPDGWYTAQCLTPTAAIAGFTLAAAQTSGQTDRLGTITPGKLADLTILDRDIIAEEPDSILKAEVLGTMVDGIFRYRV